MLKTLDFEPGEAMLRAQLADDPGAMGRIDAAKRLAKLGSTAAAGALGEALLRRRELDFVRAEVAAALGEMKSEAARDALIAAVEEPSARVRGRSPPPSATSATRRPRVRCRACSRAAATNLIRAVGRRHGAR